MRKAIVALVLACLATGVVAALPKEANAQMMTTNPVSASPQGLIGGALLGAELVTMIQGAAGLRPRWAYIVFPLVGAAAGGVGGFFVDQALDSSMPQGPALVSTAMLVAGLGLIIPAAIVYANATAYRPDDTNAQADEAGGANVPLEESSSGEATGGSTSTGGTSTTPSSPPASGTSAPESSGGGAAGGRSIRHRLGPEALMNFVPGRFRLGLPAVSMLRSYSMEEMRQYGIAAQSEWRVPVLTAVF